MPLKHKVDPDPIQDQPWTIRRGLSIDGKRDLRRLIYSHGEQFCGEMNNGGPYRGYTCTRPQGHPTWWKHIACDGYELLSVWGGGEAPENDTFIDPEDGSPADPEALVALDTVKVGDVYKLRDRKNKLVVLGGLPDVMPRKDGWIEVLDFTTRVQRAVPVAELVAADVALDVADLVFQIEFAQSLRMKMRDEAVSNYHAGKWCENGLQDGLRDLGLPRYVPQQSGTITVQIPYTATTGAGTSSIKKAVQDAIDLEELKRRLGVIDPENDDELELKPDLMKLAVEGINRR